MATLGSIMLITGAGGLVAFLVLLTFRKSQFSRTLSTIVLIVLFLITGIGLVLVTIWSGGRSLHTGG